jgi:type II secretory pathway component PulF
MSIGKARTWSITYLLPYASGPSAAPDRKSRGYFRHKEIVTAVSQADVVHDLVTRQAVPVEIKEIRPIHPMLGGRVTKGFRQQFLLSLTFSVDGGMSPGRALEQAIESETGVMRQRLNVGLNMLRQGRSFLEALRAIDLYDSTTLAIIEAGEETGTLRQALATVEISLQKSSDARKTIFSAVAWTGLDLVFAVVSIIGTRTGLIPYLREGNKGDPEQVATLNSALDVATTANDLLIVLSVIAIIVLFAGAWGYFSDDEELRNRIDSLLLKVPLVRDLLTHTAVAGTCGVMANLLSGGVHFIPATLITERGTRMVKVMNYWRTARDRVETGESPSVATAIEPFTDSEKMILRAHKDSKQLARAYSVIATQREELGKTAAKQFAVAAFMSTMLYSALGVLLVLYVVYIQNEATMHLSLGG